MPNQLRLLSLLTILLMLGGGGVAIWWLPQKQVEPLQHRIEALDRQKPTTFAELEKLAQQEKARIDAENAARAALIQGAGGLFAATAAYIAWRNLLATQEKQVAERFSKAVEQLGNDNIHVRLGGIYALEQIAKDAEKKYYWRVIETLTAYVRERSPYQPNSANPAPANTTPDAKPVETKPHPPEPKQNNTHPPIDIQSIITILSRCQPSHETWLRHHPIDLHNTDLHDLHFSVGIHLKRLDFASPFLPAYIHFQGIDLSGANLQRAKLPALAHLQWVNLKGANLQEAILDGVILEDVDLSNANLENARIFIKKSQYLNLEAANLQNAILGGAELQNAKLTNAKLQGADLHWVNLRDADLSGANLQGANLRHAESLENARLRGVDLQKVDLRGADLRGADLSDTNLQGADLREADLSGAMLCRSNLEGANLEAATLKRTEFSVHPKHTRRSAHFYDAVGLTWEQLKQAKSYKGVVLPSYLLSPQPASAAAEVTPTIDPPLSQD